MEGASNVSAGFATPRLQLRRIVHSDLDNLAQLYSVPSVTRYLVGRGPSLDWTRDQLAAVERHWEQHGFGQCAVIEKATGNFVGTVGLRVREPWDDIELVIVIAKDRQRRGYATEAGRVWVDRAREHGLTDRLVVAVLTRNQAARRTVAALGFDAETPDATAWSGDAIVHRLAPALQSASG